MNSTWWIELQGLNEAFILSSVINYKLNTKILEGMVEQE